MEKEDLSISYMKEIYKLRDYILFYAKGNEPRDIFIFYDGVDIQYGSKIKGNFHLKDQFNGKPNSFHIITNLLTKEFTEYTSSEQELNAGKSSYEAQLLQIRNTTIVMVNLTKEKANYADEDLVKNIIIESLSFIKNML